jgi:hypothetical protein
MAFHNPKFVDPHKAMAFHNPNLFHLVTGKPLAISKAQAEEMAKKQAARQAMYHAQQLAAFKAAQQAKQQAAQYAAYKNAKHAAKLAAHKAAYLEAQKAAQKGYKHPTLFDLFKGKHVVNEKTPEQQAAELEAYKAAKQARHLAAQLAAKQDAEIAEKQAAKKAAFKAAYLAQKAAQKPHSNPTILDLFKVKPTVYDKKVVHPHKPPHVQTTNTNSQQIFNPSYKHTNNQPFVNPKNPKQINNFFNATF